MFSLELWKAYRVLTFGYMKTKHLSVIRILQIVTSVLLVMAILNLFGDFFPFRKVITWSVVILSSINFFLIVYFHKEKS